MYIIYTGSKNIYFKYVHITMILFQMRLCHISGVHGQHVPKHVAAGFGAEKSFVTVNFAKEWKPHATVSTAKVSICGTR